MKRATLILLVALVSPLPATAQTTKTRRPASPSDSLLKNPVIEARMKKPPGKRYASFMESFETIRRLRGSTPVRGFVGGESHDGYVIRAREGQRLTVRLSWRREGDGRASLSVSESPDFYSAGPAKFGTEYDGGRRWAGMVPKTGDYYVYVVAHPSAHYTLKVSAR